MATPAGSLVMVVDDDPAVCAFICEILEGEGYRTRAMESGEAALSGEDRVRAFRGARAVVERFVILKQRQLEELPPTEFPLLTLESGRPTGPTSD